ncbi:MAG: hypothetical protein AAB865_00830 [Patescibacteria group bacterium]
MRLPVSRVLLAVTDIPRFNSVGDPTERVGFELVYGPEGRPKLITMMSHVAISGPDEVGIEISVNADGAFSFHVTSSPQPRGNPPPRDLVVERIVEPLPLRAGTRTIGLLSRWVGEDMLYLLEPAQGFELEMFDVGYVRCMRCNYRVSFTLKGAKDKEPNPSPPPTACKRCGVQLPTLRVPYQPLIL